MNLLRPAYKTRHTGLRALACGLALIVALMLPAQAQNALTLLDVEVGVRALGMGGAYVGVADDESTAFANPAGLSTLRAMAFEFNVESRFGRAAYGGVTLTGRNLGAGALFLNVADITGRNELGEVTAPFKYTSMAGYLSAGASLSDLSLTALQTPALDNVSLGLRAQFYRADTLPGGDGGGVSLSPAFLFELPVGGTVDFLRVGAVVENLLPLGVGYGSGHGEPWRIGARLGASVGLLDDLLLAAEFETAGVFHLGGEFRFSNLNTPEISGLALRAGMITLRGGPMFTLGLGAKFSTFEVNYAFTSHPELSASHRLAFTARFANQTLVCLFTGFDDVGICDP